VASRQKTQKRRTTKFVVSFPLGEYDRYGTEIGTSISDCSMCSSNWENDFYPVTFVDRVAFYLYLD